MNPGREKVIVVKMNPQGEETWRYEGWVLSRRKNSLLIEAYFNRSDFPFHEITLKSHDRFLERYYQDRWYNIFAIYDRDDGRLKAYYCNITQPAVFSADKVSYVDLALDLLVYPDGRYIVLDEDEFETLELNEKSQKKAREALKTLIAMAENGQLAQEI